MGEKKRKTSKLVMYTQWARSEWFPKVNHVLGMIVSATIIEADLGDEVALWLTSGVYSNVPFVIVDSFIFICT